MGSSLIATCPISLQGNGKQLLQYPWVAYCNDKGLGPMTGDKCGKHLRVTNPTTGQWVIVTVVDMCGQGGVDMDPIAFNAVSKNLVCSALHCQLGGAHL